MAESDVIVTLRLTASEAGEVDRVRGSVKRATWIKSLCREAVAADGALRPEVSAMCAPTNPLRILQAFGSPGTNVYGAAERSGSGAWLGVLRTRQATAQIGGAAVHDSSVG